MEQSQLVELIKTLTPEEKKQALEFSTLSFFPRSKIKSYINPLLQLCLKHPWQDTANPLDKKMVQAAIFAGQPYVEGKLEKVMVEAHKVIQSYLQFQYYFREENEFHQLFDLAEVIRTRGLTTRYRPYLTRLRKMQEEAPTRSALFFHDQYLLEYAVHNEESLYNQKKGDLNVPQALDALEMHELLNRLALLNVFLLQQKAANISVPESMQERLENTQVPARYLELSPPILINYTIFILLKKDIHDAADVQILFDLLHLHEKKLDPEALNGYYAYLRNICALILLKDPEQEDIHNLLFELYKDNLERGYLHYEGKLHPSKYMAISERAALAGEHEWALEFIEKYKDQIIGENETRDIYRLNRAVYLFSVGRYAECLDYIPDTSPHIDYFLVAKRLELKTLYELKSDLLSYRLEAFKMYLSRTSHKVLPDARKQKHLDFANLLFQIVHSKPGDPKRVAQLTARVEEKKQASERKWLFQKVRELK